MSFNLKEELLKLSSTTPAFKDSDDELDHDLTKAKLDDKSAEFEDDFDLSAAGNKRMRQAVGSLDDLGKRYKGKKTTRNQMDDGNDSEEEQNDESDDLNLHLSAEEDGEEDEGDEDDEDDDEESEADDVEIDEEGQSDEEEDEQDDEDELPAGQAKKFKSDGQDTQADLNILNNTNNNEIEKGTAIKNQLGFWEFLLETRVKFQNVLNVVNQFPQYDIYNEALTSLKPDMRKSTEDILNENKKTILKLLNQSIELQQLMFSTDNETAYLVDSRNENKHLKGGSDGSESEAETGDGEDEDEDDDEIFSDTDEEFAANQKSSADKKSENKAKNGTVKNLKDVQIKHFKQEIIEPHLDKVNRNFNKHKNAIIQKWYDKTRLTSGKSFESFEKPILAQIEHIIQDRERLLKRTQLKRSVYKIYGKEVDKAQEVDNRHANDYDKEVFDDQDFYNQLMRELIERKTSNCVDPVELSRKSIELQKLRAKSKKVVDTKASKGRKIKFNTHKPMVNFMAPIFRNQLSEEARNELFRSLFGNHVTLATSNSDANIKMKAAVGSGDLGFQDLFKTM